MTSDGTGKDRTGTISDCRGLNGLVLGHAPNSVPWRLAVPLPNQRLGRFMHRHAIEDNGHHCPHATKTPKRW